jgi:hypothetical protein
MSIYSPFAIDHMAGLGSAKSDIDYFDAMVALIPYLHDAAADAEHKWDKYSKVSDIVLPATVLSHAVSFTL